MEKSNTKVRRTYTAADKERLLRSFLTSGQTIKQWCQEHQVGLSTLHRWRQDERVTTAVSPVQTWAPVVTVSEKASTLTVKAGAFHITVSADTDCELLANVLAVVNSVC